MGWCGESSDLFQWDRAVAIKHDSLHFFSVPVALNLCLSNDANLLPLDHFGLQLLADWEYRSHFPSMRMFDVALRKGPIAVRDMSITQGVDFEKSLLVQSWSCLPRTTWCFSYVYNLPALYRCGWGISYSDVAVSECGWVSYTNGWCIGSFHSIMECYSRNHDITALSNLDSVFRCRVKSCSFICQQLPWQVIKKQEKYSPGASWCKNG